MLTATLAHYMYGNGEDRKTVWPKLCHEIYENIENLKLKGTYSVFIVKENLFVDRTPSANRMAGNRPHDRDYAVHMKRDQTSPNYLINKLITSTTVN